MDCTHPVVIRNPNWLSDVRKGQPVFGRSLKFSDLPEEAGIRVPCGKCFNCRRRIAREWTHRLILENEYYEDAVFITLTYDDEHLPLTKNCHMTLVKKDLQDFYKRLRYNLDSYKISHFSCGEYGDRYGRPHYHGIVFGLSREDQDVIDKSWKKGLTHVGNVNSKSIAYVAGYVQKKLYGKYADQFEGIQPFSLCSSRPGIGRRFCEDHMLQIYDDGFIQFPGYKIGIPRYFRKVLSENGYEFDYSYFQAYQEEANEEEKDYWISRLGDLTSIVEHDDGYVEIFDIDNCLPALTHYKNCVKEKQRVAKANLFKKGSM